MPFTTATRKAYRLRVQAWLDQYKLDHGCADCGYRAYAIALQFDHKPEYRRHGDKRLAMANLVHRLSLSAIQREVNKCDVVCANCHIIREHIRDPLRSHGSGLDEFEATDIADEDQDAPDSLR